MQNLHRKQTAKDLGEAIISSRPKNTHLGRNGINTLEEEEEKIQLPSKSRLHPEVSFPPRQPSISPGRTSSSKCAQLCFLS